MSTSAPKERRVLEADVDFAVSGILCVRFI